MIKAAENATDRTFSFAVLRVVGMWFVLSTVPAYHNQAGFVINTHNKSLFIQMFAAQLQHQYTVLHAVDAADTLIVKTALEFSVNAEPVTVVADHSDILVLLVHHFNQSMADLYMWSATGGQKAKTACAISIRDCCR